MGTTSPILLATLVVALLLAATAAATRPCDDTDAIRLPTGGSAVGGWPWNCCDFVERHPSRRPPLWRCNDVVDKCSGSCRDCVESEAGDGYVCRDWVTSIVEPRVCTPRPWDCCDNAICTRARIPTCRCADIVDKCPSNCKKCGIAPGFRVRCLDTFHGYPGPKCTPWIV